MLPYLDLDKVQELANIEKGKVSIDDVVHNRIIEFGRVRCKRPFEEDLFSQYCT